uniref:Sodium/nucleoside cotransporter n=1 Tax=Clastoptera arizonana TaxID=38151 RepID=A0A1B6E3E3_9HEMI
MKNQKIVQLLFRICILVLIVVYLGFVIKNWYNQGQPSLGWCGGTGILLLLIVFICWCLIYYKFMKPILFKRILGPCLTSDSTMKIHKVMSTASTSLIWILTICIFAFVIYDSYGYKRRLISFAGIFVFIFIAFIFSKQPILIPWRTVAVGTLMQYIVGLLAIRWNLGRDVFICVGNLVNSFLTFSYSGAQMVYGTELVNVQGVFAFQALSVIFFMSMIIQILFYLEWMQIVLKKMGWFIQTLMGTTVCESMNAVGSVFLGISEAPLLYKPYIKDLTRSEMHAVMVGGLSTTAGTVFAAYAALGANPTHILTASAMTSPAALMYAKILFPETENSKTDANNLEDYKSPDTSLLDAATQGALVGVNIVQGIIASVIAAVSFIAFANSMVGWFLSQAGVPDTDLEMLVAYALIPVAWIMGVKPDNCQEVARLLGIKTIVNEFVGYAELGKLKTQGILSARSEAIATYAMCSFANPGSVAILASNLLTLSPSQRTNITKVTVRAFFGAFITSLLTACVAGSLMPEEGYENFDAKSNI